jgi:hypothetical protein
MHGISDIQLNGYIMEQEERNKKISQLIAKCWSDDGFKQKLLADTHATLKSEGMDVPAGMTVKAIENSDKLVHLVIPPTPADLSDDDLDKVAGGIDFCGPAKLPKFTCFF